MPNSSNAFFLAFFLFCSSLDIISSRPSCSAPRYPEYSTVCEDIHRVNTTSIDHHIRNAAPEENQNTLRLSGYRIHLSPSTLKYFPKLETFALNGCSFEAYCCAQQIKTSTIASNAFAGNGNPNLYSIELHGINFPNMENLRSVFQPLFDRLTYLSMKHCSFSQSLSPSWSGPEISTAEYNRFQVISQFTHLSTFRMRNSDLTTIPARAFEKSTASLKNLHLERNKIKKIDVDAFKGLANLTQLHLEHNQIVSIEPGTFDDLISLERIHLEENLISILPPTLFESMGVSISVYLIDNPYLVKQNFTAPGGYVQVNYDD